MKEKTCSKCKDVKVMSEFHKHKQSKDGHKGQCKACVCATSEAYRLANRERVNARQTARRAGNAAAANAYQQRWREANPDKCRASQVKANGKKRAEYAENPSLFLEKNRKWRKDNPELFADMQRRGVAKAPNHKKANHAVAYAIKTGDLSRGPCEECGTTVDVQAHHWDYREEFWLDVQWLCRTHHTIEHNRLRGLEVAERS